MTKMRYMTTPVGGARLYPVLSMPTEGPAGSGNGNRATAFGAGARSCGISGEDEQRNGRRVCATGGDM